MRCCRPSAALPRPAPAPPPRPCAPAPRVATSLVPLADLAPGPRRTLGVILAALKRGCSPSYKELQATLGFRSPQSVVGHVRVLAEAGWLTCGGKVARNLALTPSARAALRGCRAEGGHVLVSMYAACERLTAGEARGLAAELNAAANALEGGA